MSYEPDMRGLVPIVRHAKDIRPILYLVDESGTDDIARLYSLGTLVGTITATGTIAFAGLQITTLGSGILRTDSSGNVSAAAFGSGNLIGGNATVSLSSITASSKVFLSNAGGGVMANVGSLYVASVTAGVGFTVSSTNVLDNSAFNYIVI